MATSEIMLRRLALLCAGLAIGLFIGLHAQSTPTIRKMLETVDLGNGKEARMWIAEVAPGAATFQHTHPGHILAYMLDGSITHTVKGKPPVTLSTGASWQEFGEVHQGRNLSATAPARFLTIQITEHAQPMSQ